MNRSVRDSIQPLICHFCEKQCINQLEMEMHLVCHGIRMENQNLIFENYEQFLKWKTDYETANAVLFVTKCKFRDEKRKIIYFICARSGINKVISLKYSDKAISKIDANCPARMRVNIKSNDNKVFVDFTSTHVCNIHVKRDVHSVKRRKIEYTELEQTQITATDAIEPISQTDLKANNDEKLKKFISILRNSSQDRNIDKTVKRNKAASSSIQEIYPQVELSDVIGDMDLVVDNDLFSNYCDISNVSNCNFQLISVQTNDDAKHIFSQFMKLSEEEKLKFRNLYDNYNNNSASFDL